MLLNKKKEQLDKLAKEIQKCVSQHNTDRGTKIEKITLKQGNLTITLTIN